MQPHKPGGGTAESLVAQKKLVASASYMRPLSCSAPLGGPQRPAHMAGRQAPLSLGLRARRLGLGFSVEV